MNRIRIIALALAVAVVATAARSDALSELNNEQAQRIRALTASQQGVLLPLDGALDPAASQPVVEAAPAVSPPPEEAAVTDEAAMGTAMDESATESLADVAVAPAEETAAAEESLSTPPLEPSAEDQAPAEDAAADTAGADLLPDLGEMDDLVVAELGNPASIGPYRLWLASFKTVREAQAGWQQLAKDNRDVLGDLVPVIVMKELGDSGTFFRLQAGPLTEQAQAQDRCDTLKARSLYCAILGPDDG